MHQQKPMNSFSIHELPNSCKAIVANKPYSQKIYVTLTFNKAGIFNNSNEKHGISALLSNLLFNKIGNLSKEETKKKLAQLGLSDLSLRSESHNFVISFNVVESLFEPAIEFFVLGFKPKFSENELSYAKEFVPIPVDPEISNPEEILSVKLYQNLYPNHVYGKNTTGSSEAIATITLKDINEFLKNNFALDNLSIYFSGKYSSKKLKFLFNALKKVLPEKSNLSPFQKCKDIAVNSSDQKITNKNIKDISGIMTGIRFDDLSLKETAALFIVSSALFNKSFGKFTTTDFPMSFNYSIDNRKHSTVLVLSSFVNKKDLEAYLKNLNNLLEKTTLDQIEKLNLAKKYFVTKQTRGFYSLHSVPDKMFFFSLPFDQCEEADYKNILKKIKNKKMRCTAVISSE